jgi:ferrous iron transport protein B
MTPAPLVALVGNPNAGKSALFNALTGARQKVGNYPGVTVERKSGRLSLPDGRPIELIDLPGAYSLDPASPDEAVTRDVVLGRQDGERQPDVIVIVMDATNLDNHLRFALQLIALGIPVVIALNMIDMARRDGLEIDVPALSRALGVPVVATVAVRKRGIEELLAALANVTGQRPRPVEPIPEDIVTLQRRARAIAAETTVEHNVARRWTRSLDRVALHPVIGPILLAALMFVMFQSVFAWAQYPMAVITGWQEALAGLASRSLPPGVLRSLIVDGVISGVGSVVVFLPQILVLFLFILLLEASGYMVRAAFLMDQLMARVGLSGRAFIPLLSSFACAVPGIMATRTIDDPKDRLTTILVAPLMTCSARLPVYAIIIAAFIPARQLLPGVGLQGLVLFTLYLAGILGAMIVALVLRRTVTRGQTPGFMMEMPKYQMPGWRDVTLGLWQRAMIFLKRAGTIILVSNLVLWALVFFPRPPAGYDRPAIDYSIAGRVANAVEPGFRPIGFNRYIVLALIPAMAAREVAVSALGTVYALQSRDAAAPGVAAPTDADHGLVSSLRHAWPLPTALAFLAWFVFAPQCLSTLAVTRRETNGWRWPAFMLSYLFVLAYLASGATYWAAKAFGL